MKECPKCGNQHNKNSKFCSRSCANSRVWSDEDKKKKSESAKNSEKVKLANTRDSEFYDKIVEVRRKNHKHKILTSDYSDLSFESLRFRILYEQNSCCNKCKLDKWLGENIPLELEHKDGNNKNNLRVNLEMLCPNCHAQTETWRGRNKTNKRLKVSDENLFNSLMINEWNMRQALLDVGLSAKGGNYKRCHKLKREYESIKT